VPTRGRRRSADSRNVSGRRGRGLAGPPGPQGPPGPGANTIRTQYLAAGYLSCTTLCTIFHLNPVGKTDTGRSSFAITQGPTIDVSWVGETDLG
jgi:hypothetical protein